jgi:predicted nucleotidyltransferase
MGCGSAGTGMNDPPIEPAIRAEIDARLAAIEAEYGVRVLYACESGSRGWGFASPDSDYDVRFLYVHPLPWYLQVSAARDVIELPISGELDINGWELRKALALLKNGNATLIEWLHSPVVYRADECFLGAMRDAAQRTHRPERSMHHYLHMARRNHRDDLRGETVRLKKYLYVLRPLLAALWTEQGRGVVPMRFEALVDAIVSDAGLRGAIEQLLIAKRAAMESEASPPLPAITAFIEAELARLEATAPPASGGIDFSVLDRLLMDTVLRFDARNRGDSSC